MNGSRLLVDRFLLGLKGNLLLGLFRFGKMGLGFGSGLIGLKRGLSGGNWLGVFLGLGMSELIGFLI